MSSRKPPRKRPASKAPSRRGRIRRRTRLCACVHTLEEACAALRAARAAKSRVTLLSPPGAAAYLGIGFFWALVEAARAAEPGVTVEAVMDCGEEPGWALAALRVGFKSVVLAGDRRVRNRVAAIAGKCGARILARPPAVAV